MALRTHKNGDLATSFMDTSQSSINYRNSYRLIENEGKFGKKQTYQIFNGKVIKTRNVGTTSSIIFFFKNLFKQIFLPVGFPDSVSEDYVSYQIWDTVQAFCSTITGTFTTQSILKSVGVGDDSASALGAAITWIIKDGSGMGGRIIFAWWQGNSLDADCKSWRLFADVLNDLALAIEFTLPYWNVNIIMYMLCITSTMKSIVGVAGGASRAAITQHQAVQGNMGDVSAKDGSQETCVNLLASICGIFLLTYFEKKDLYLGLIFLLLTFIHIYANYKAVHALVFKHLNLTRLLMVFHSYLQFDAVPSPPVVNKLEPVVFPGSSQNVAKLCGFGIKMGSSLQIPFKTISAEQFTALIKAFKGHKYVIVPCLKNRTLYVGFDHKIDSELTIRAYFHAVMLGIALSQYNNFLLNFKTKRQLHHVTPLQRLNNTMKKIPRNQNRSLDIFSLDNFLLFNDFITGEASSFFTALGVNNWELNRNSIIVGEWRCNFNESNLPNSSTSKKLD